MSGYRGASRGFPPAFEEESIAPLAVAAALPFSAVEIEAYVRNGHYHLCLEEPPLQFSFAGVLKERSVEDRRYWIVQIRDEWDRVWLVFAGSGKSCLRPDRYMPRWMVGVQPDGSLGPEEMLTAEIEAQNEHDRLERTRLNKAGS